MTINFNSLPTEKPSNGFVIPKGQYLATIVKAEMRQGKDLSKPPYLNLELDLTDTVSKTSAGKIWAIITESEASLQRYQLARLIKALELPITGDFELKDLTKIIINKQMLVDVCPEEKKDGTTPQRSIIDINAGEIFYSLNEKKTPDSMEAIDADMPTSYATPPLTPEPIPSVQSQY